jgi:hypothetical protein
MAEAFSVESTAAPRCPNGWRLRLHAWMMAIVCYVSSDVHPLEAAFFRKSWVSCS